MIELIIALILTILIEWGIYSAFIRKKTKNLLLFSVLINGITNPLANLFANLEYILIIEVFVIIVEIPLIMLLTREKLGKSVLISLVANIISFIVGTIVTMF